MIVPGIEDIRLSLEKYAYDILHGDGIAFARKNFKFEPKDYQIWSRVTARFGQTETLELGKDEPLGKRSGVFIIQIFILPNTDVGIGERLCANIEKAFRYVDLSGVHCEEPYMEEIGLDADNAWYQFNVNVPFWTWIGK
jgi:hypothetical protein